MAGKGRREVLEEGLRTAGCRLTRQRRAVLGHLGATRSHPSARQIHRALRKAVPGLSLATVYNTLGTLARLGLIRVIDFESVDNRVDTDVGPHINLICTGCGGIGDLETGFPVPPREVRARSGFEVRGVRMEYYGICAACAAGRSKT